MNNKVVYENVSRIQNRIFNGDSETNLVRDNSFSSRYTTSVSNMNVDQHSMRPIHSSSSRSPDDISNSTDLNSNRTSLEMLLKNDLGSTHIIGDDQPPPYTRNGTNTSKENEDLGRWDEAWEKHEKEQSKNGEINPLDKNININPVHPTIPLPVDLPDAYVKEFSPNSANDPTFAVLRDLFIRSFDEFYKGIGNQLNLKSDKSLIQWLDETFDEEQEEILQKRYRCFVLYGHDNQDPKDNILGFLTLKEEEEGSIYIAQVAIRNGIKRRGYGAKLLQHLRNIYPSNTQYWGLCRRANRPALQFYLKQGAQFMKNDDVATKYGYDPGLYAGFEFTDIVSIVPAKPLSTERFPTSFDLNQSKTTSTDNVQNHSSTNDTSSVENEVKTHQSKVVGCCIIS